VSSGLSQSPQANAHNLSAQTNGPMDCGSPALKAGFYVQGRAEIPKIVFRASLFWQPRRTFVTDLARPGTPPLPPPDVVLFPQEVTALHNLRAPLPDDAASTVSGKTDRSFGVVRGNPRKRKWPAWLLRRDPANVRRRMTIAANIVTMGQHASGARVCA